MVGVPGVLHVCSRIVLEPVFLITSGFQCQVEFYVASFFYYKSTRLKRKSSHHENADTTLYPVTVISDLSERVRIHYIGYGSQHDEWRNKDDILPVTSPCLTTEKFDLHQELAVKVKSSLLGGRKSNPAVKITMSYDLDTFNEGLGRCGYVTKTVRGVKHYKIQQYNELDHILGPNWHYRGINAAGDFCYVVPESIEYYLNRHRGIVHYVPDENCKPVRTIMPHGYSLTFKYVRADGTPSEFGKNDSIFKS